MEREGEWENIRREEGRKDGRKKGWKGERKNDVLCISNVACLYFEATSCVSDAWRWIEMEMEIGLKMKIKVHKDPTRNTTPGVGTRHVARHGLAGGHGLGRAPLLV